MIDYSPTIFRPCKYLYQVNRAGLLPVYYHPDEIDKAEALYHYLKRHFGRCSIRKVKWTVVKKNYNTGRMY